MPVTNQRRTAEEPHQILARLEANRRCFRDLHLRGANRHQLQLVRQEQTQVSLETVPQTLTTQIDLDPAGSAAPTVVSNLVVLSTGPGACMPSTNQDTCPVCYLEMGGESGPAVRTPCDHLIHRTCAEGVFFHCSPDADPGCPVCRRSLLVPRSEHDRRHNVTPTAPDLEAGAQSAGVIVTMAGQDDHEETEEIPLAQPSLPVPILQTPVTPSAFTLANDARRSTVCSLCLVVTLDNTNGTPTRDGLLYRATCGHSFHETCVATWQLTDHDAYLSSREADACPRCERNFVNGERSNASAASLAAYGVATELLRLEAQHEAYANRYIRPPRYEARTGTAATTVVVYNDDEQSHYEYSDGIRSAVHLPAAPNQIDYYVQQGLGLGLPHTLGEPASDAGTAYSSSH